MRTVIFLAFLLVAGVAHGQQLNPWNEAACDEESLVHTGEYSVNPGQTVHWCFVDLNDTSPFLKVAAQAASLYFDPDVVSQATTANVQVLTCAAPVLATCKTKQFEIEGILESTLTGVSPRHEMPIFRPAPAYIVISPTVAPLASDVGRVSVTGR